MAMTAAAVTRHFKYGPPGSSGHGYRCHNDKRNRDVGLPIHDEN